MSQHNRRLYAIEKILQDKKYNKVTMILPHSDDPELFLWDHAQPKAWKRLYLFGPLTAVNFQKDYLELLFQGSVSLTNWKYRYSYNDRSFILSEQ